MTKRKPYYSLQSFFSYLSHYKLRFVVVFTSFMIADILLAVIPLLIGQLVGNLAAQPIDTHQAYIYVGLLIACSTGHDMMWHVGELTYLKLFNPLGFHFETLLFRQIIHKPYPYFVDKFTGKISSYINTISQEFRDQLEKVFWDYAGHIVSLVAISAILTAMNWQTGVSFMSGILLMAIVGRYTVRNSTKYEKIWTDVQSTKNAKIIDTIANFTNVKSFQKEARETKRIAHEQMKTLNASRISFLWSLLFWGSLGFIVRNIIWPGTIILNVYLFVHHQISLADLTTFLTAVLLFSTYIWEIIWSLSNSRCAWHELRKPMPTCLVPQISSANILIARIELLLPAN